MTKHGVTADDIAGLMDRFRAFSDLIESDRTLYVTDLSDFPKRQAIPPD